MIKLITNKPKINNDIADIIRLFYSFEKIIYDDSKKADISFYHEHIEYDNNTWEEKTTFCEGGIKKDYFLSFIPNDISTEVKYKRMLKRSAMLAFYNMLKEISEKKLPWGALTGIRPTHLYRTLDKESGGCAHSIMSNDYDVSENKLKLVEAIIDRQEEYYKVDRKTSVNLYIGIPFCPTRCEYCSFISFDMSNQKPPIDEYTAALKKEIIWFNKWRKDNNKTLRSIYIGGGTPTSIGIDYLREIIEEIDFNHGIEFTVEAGRPDTINYDMLEMLENSGVNRISINPQSMNDETLKKMKRPHSSSDIKEAYRIARQFNFVINMDLILGLEGENIDSIKNTLNEMEMLMPDNLTIHTLAVKRASKLKEKIDSYNFTDEDTINEMVEVAQKRAYEMGMHPYYMYRQKYMSGNLENVGYAYEGKDCTYNIDIMEETHNLVALGAGAVSKRMYFEEKYHKRFYNNKSISHYIDKIDEQLLKKDDFFAYN